MARVDSKDNRFLGSRNQANISRNQAEEIVTDEMLSGDGHFAGRINNVRIFESHVAPPVIGRPRLGVIPEVIAYAARDMRRLLGLS